MSRGRHFGGLVLAAVLAISGLIAGTPVAPAVAAAMPQVSKVTPEVGKAAGGTVVLLTGVGFTGTTQVVFGRRAGTKIKVVSDTELMVVAPAGSGTVSVSVTSPAGTSPVSQNATFRYVPASNTFVAPPKVTKVSPTTGPLTGGTKVTVNGTGFIKITGVRFGDTPGTKVKVSSSKRLTVVAPAGTGGTVEVSVTGAYGTSPVSRQARYSYISPPTITGLSPNRGSVKGGTRITITGTRFTRVLKVLFGIKAGTKLSVKSSTTLTVLTPAQTARVVDVKVVTAYGTSPTSSNARYTYGTPAPPTPGQPTITSITPTSGTTAGGTSVTIAGTGLAGTTRVTVGGVEATDLTVGSDTQVTATTPIHAVGTADVVLTAPGGTVTLAHGYRYVAVPAVTSISPNAGSTLGGQTVTIEGSHLSGAAQVAFGTVTAETMSVVSDTQLTVTAPPASEASVVDLTVTDTDGNTSPLSSADRYTYRAPVIPDAVSEVVEPGTQTTVTAGAGYAATIPAEALQEAATVTVTPQHAVDGRPTVDVHIDRAWTGSVGVTLPVPERAPDTRPIVLHDAADGLRLSSGSGITTGTTDGVATVTAQLTSLSEVHSGAVYCGANELQGTVVCSDTHDQTYDQWAIQRAQGEKAFYLDAVNHENEPCGMSNGTVSARGDVPFGISCETFRDDSTGRYEFYNNMQSTVAFWSAGALYSYDLAGGTHSTPNAEPPEGVPYLMEPFVASVSNHDILPGGTLKLTKELDSPDTRLSLAGDPIATAHYYGIVLAANQIGGELFREAQYWPSVAEKFTACNSTSLDDSLQDCMWTAFTALLDYAAQHPELLPRNLKYVAKNAGIIGELLTAADVGAYGASITTSMIGAATASSVTLSNKLLIDPPNDRGGTDYIARDPNTGQAVRVLSGNPYLITTGSDFDCLAQSRYIWDISALKALDTDPVGAVLTCDESGRTPWDYAPQPDGGNIPNNTILRDPDGHAWLINNLGEIQTISDGGTYLCLANANPVIWNVPDSAISGWTPVGGEPASCGGIAIPPAPDLAIGEHHTCTRTSAGEVQCWGANEYGQLGDGTTQENQEPHQVIGLAAGVRQIAAGMDHTCALTDDRRVVCWGLNSHGQVGDGTTANRTEPTVVSGVAEAVGIVAGAYHTCAWNALGTMWCWGYNYAGQIGDGTYDNDRPAPVLVSTSASLDIAGAAAGPLTTCLVARLAPSSDGSAPRTEADCWGGNNHEQLGSGWGSSAGFYPTPIRVPTGDNLVQLGAGNLHTCALDDEGFVHCWGANDSGEGGRDPSDAADVLDWTVPITQAATAVAAGDSFTCALLESGQVSCWGSNQNGQLGDETEGARSTPGLVPGIEGAIAVVAMSSRACALLKDRSVVCWGGRDLGPGE